MKACKSLHTAAAIALKLSQSSINCVEDLWSLEKIDFEFDPRLQNYNNSLQLGQIIFRSFLKYLERPGQVTLPAGMISPEDFQREQKNPVFRVRKLWEFWHGSQTLDFERRRTVSMRGGFILTSNMLTFPLSQVYVNAEKLERPKEGDPTEPIPMKVQACFDRLEICLNQPLMDLMKEHLSKREKEEYVAEDTAFDCWVHEQIYQPDYNMA